MGRILAIDYGSKRCGLAVSDPLKLIASGLTTLHSKDLIDYLKNYSAKEQLEIIVVGEPKTLMNEKSASARFIDPFVNQLRTVFPEIKIERYDERFTSKRAMQSMIEGGLKKKDRQKKETVDLISAIIILQDYMNANGY